MAVPRPRPSAVELRRIDVDVVGEPRPRLLVGEEIAALPEKHVVEQRFQLGEAHELALKQLVEPPARRRLRHHYARVRIDERRADVPEVEGVADAAAHPTQNLGVRRLARDP